MTTMKNLLLILFSAGGLALAGCGGGASTTPEPGPAPAPAPAPTPPPQTDDHGGTGQTATEIRLPSTTQGETTTQGEIEVNNDIDTFRFRLRSPATLTVYTTGSTDTAGTLVGPNDLSVNDTDGGSGANFRIVVPRDRTSAGTYIVTVSGVSTGDYELHVQFSEGDPGNTGQGDDHGDTEQTATVVGVPSTTPGEIHSGNDVDYFRLQVRSAGTLTVFTTGSTDTQGVLTGPAGPAGADDDSGSLLNFRIAAVVSPGVHHVRVSSLRSSVGAYALEVQFSAEQGDDHGNTEQTATVVQLPSTTRGELEVDYDVDFFRFELRSPATLTVYTTGSTDMVGNLQGPGLGVGSRVESDDGAGSDANFRIVMFGALPGTYYVGVTGAFSFTVGDYELHVRAEDPGGSGTTGQGDVHGDTEQTATVVRLPSTTPGRIHSSDDVDYFRLEIRRFSGTLTVHTTGSTDTLGVLTGEPFHRAVSFRDRRDDDSGSQRNFSIEALVSTGIYYVRVRSSRSSLGEYALHVRFSEDDHGDTEQTATTVQLPSTTQAEIEVDGDTDYFRFELQSLTTLFFEARERIRPYIDSLSLFLTGPDGISVNFDSVHRGFVVEATPGVYQLRVRRRQFTVGEITGEYELQVWTDESEASVKLHTCHIGFGSHIGRIMGVVYIHQSLRNVSVRACMLPNGGERNCDRSDRYFVEEEDLGAGSTGQSISWSVARGIPRDRRPVGDDYMCVATLQYN